MLGYQESSYVRSKSWKRLLGPRDRRYSRVLIPVFELSDPSTAQMSRSLAGATALMGVVSR